MNRPLFVALLAVSLMLPVVPLSDDGARALDSADVCFLSMRNNPLWITQVEPFEVDPDPGDGTFVTSEGAVFAEPGAEVAFEVTIENRFDEVCPGATDGLADEVRLALRYHDVNYSATSLEGPGPETWQTGELNCDLEEPGEVCTATIRLPVSVDEDVQPASTESGEQRVRFVAYDRDAEPEGQGADWRLTDCARDDDLGVGFQQSGACAGAERVIVTENASNQMMLPDLSFEQGGTGLVEEAPMTTYTQEFTDVSYNVTNEGTYPNWNPNGLLGDDHDYYSHSTFDADGTGEDGYGVAEERNHAPTENYDYKEEPGPECREEETAWPFESGEPRCSYRAGQILQVDVGHEIQRERTNALVEQGSNSLYSSSTLSDYSVQKQEAILPQDHPTGTFVNRTVEILDRYKRAGVFGVDLGLDVADRVPETSEADNDYGFDVDILGVDLDITEPRVVVETEDGSSDCPESDPCPLEGSWIVYDPRYENRGDGEADGELTGSGSPAWLASVYLEGEMVDAANQSHVPSTDADTSTVFQTRQQVRPLAGGGAQTVEIRLDHPDSYGDHEDWPPVGDPKGRIGERIEGNDCPEDDPTLDEADNRYCVTFWFEEE